MSTKTSIKRTALVAVSALGFGLMSVVPAKAAAISALSAGSSAPARVGVASGLTVITATNALVADATTVTAQITAAPAGSTAASLDFVDGSSIVTGVDVNDTNDGTASRVSTATNQQAALSAGIAFADFTSKAAGVSSFGITLNADVAGSYTILVTGNGIKATGWAAGLVSTSYIVTTAGTPTSLSLSAINSTTYDNNANGSLVKVSLKDSTGAATSLGLNESLTLTASSGSTLANFGGVNAYLAASDFLRGYAYFRVTQNVAADTTDLISVTGSGVLNATLNAQVSIKILVADATADVLAVVNATALNTYGTLAAPAQPVRSGATGYGLTARFPAATAGGTDYKATETYSTFATITDTSGLITGIPGAVFARGFAAAVGDASVTVTGGVALGNGGQLTIVFEGTTRNYTGVLSSTAYTIGAISPATTFSATGGTNVFTARVTDDFGLAVANAAITADVSAGRNVAKAATNMISDANGFVSYTLVDSGTAGATDTVRFRRTADLGGGVTATITYGTLAVGTVTITGGNTTAGVTATTPTVNPIEADNTPESATINMAATVKDAAGNLLSGVPVTFTLDTSTGAAFTTTTATAYTNGSGVATGVMYAWLAGTYTITATAGGKTGTATATFAQSRAADARTISVSASRPVVTAKVVDRFGNPVQGVSVYATKTGSGYFGNGATKLTDVTGSDGTVDFVFNGEGTVTVSTINYAVANAKGSGQTCARAGYIDCNDVAADDTAFTATTAGSTTVNAKNVGSSFAPAGVASASVAITVPVDTSAVDAANAATDAANLAAEAADAATVAAEEARDAADAATAAVEALASEVATLIAGLKAQITTLANTVAKIAKKVRA